MSAVLYRSRLSTTASCGSESESLELNAEAGSLLNMMWSSDEQKSHRLAKNTPALTSMMHISSLTTMSYCPQQSHMAGLMISS